MNEQDRDPIITIALMAALADGAMSDAEKGALRAAAYRLGVQDFDGIAQRVAAGTQDLGAVVAQLSGADAREAAYDTAAAACHADGPASPQEAAFLGRLATALGLAGDAAGATNAQAGVLGAAVASPSSGTTAGATGSPGALQNHDEFIQKQAIITAALELLPERLSTLAVLPMQGRMVYRIAQSYGYTLDSRQVAELAAAVGLGAAGQVVERTVSRLLGGLAKGLLGGMVGGATSLASAAGVTFAATYALGHAANQYYARGRQMSSDDMRSLFGKLQGDAQQIFPRVQNQVRQQASTLNLQQVIAQVRGGAVP
jgi:uncharacterized protein (DUF697 family)/tellurite resistance protein